MMFACGLPSMGQHQTFTLDECIESALRNNVRIKNAENELKMAEQDKKEAFTKYFLIFLRPEADSLPMNLW